MLLLLKVDIYFQTNSAQSIAIIRKYFNINKQYLSVKYNCMFCAKKSMSQFGWLVVYGFHGPLRQYFSLHRAVSREREIQERNDR